MSSLEHGGNLTQATIEYGEPPQGWIDLSTGINPNHYPLPTQTLTHSQIWQRLPEPDQLEATAAEYYACPHLTPVPGSQAAISLLPALRSRSRVAIAEPEYAEHSRAWQSWGHEIRRITAQQIESGPQAGTDWEVLVLSNPNNPTGRLYDPELLVTWHKWLQRNSGWLIVDEAFADCYPEFSLSRQAGKQDRQGLIVLRSLGKFFGLAGARVGFLLGPQQIRNRLAELLGPWPLSGASRQLGIAALADTAWQQQQRLELGAAADRLAAALDKAGLKVAGKTSLYCWIETGSARQIQKTLAEGGIWVRAFDNPPGLRFGLPGSEADWQRLLSNLPGAFKHSPGAI
ncbi:L-threonine 3-O-phosphate decarboxylase [Halorhodospira halochloris]|uniref:threonine-phosphate decarboxylase n=1 Tax=Halorhodospira halochloris TaxID=1052 RepID=A0A110B552_HALHR|nr:threonine-phosphate decarboxylase CobD [Halorhodospira halochloris]BAU57670.1 L-threonine 3-O-phosphate decarboxylase [Halorhodospira halochloris]